MYILLIIISEEGMVLNLYQLQSYQLEVQPFVLLQRKQMPNFTNYYVLWFLNMLHDI